MFPPTTEEPTGPGLSSEADAGSTRLLSWLLQASPFLDLHHRAGDPAAHRGRGVLCFGVDFLLRAAVVVLLLGIIGAVAWKTLAPLPLFWQPNP